MRKSTFLPCISRQLFSVAIESFLATVIIRLILKASKEEKKINKLSISRSKECIQKKTEYCRQTALKTLQVSNYAENKREKT